MRYSRNKKLKVNGTYCLSHHTRSSKAAQILDDLNPDTVMNGIFRMRAKNAFLVNKAIDASEGVYMKGEDADDHIENLTKINDIMINKVTNIAQLVIIAVNKAKDGQKYFRKKCREEVLNKDREDIDGEDPKLLLKMKEKNKLYVNVNIMRKEIYNIKMKIKLLGTSEKIANDKNRYKHNIEANYELYKEIKVLQNIKKKHSKVIEELKEITPGTMEYIQSNRDEVFTYI